jgi:hypothetical protein
VCRSVEELAPGSIFTYVDRDDYDAVLEQHSVLLGRETPHTQLQEHMQSARQRRGNRRAALRQRRSGSAPLPASLLLDGITSVARTVLVACWRTRM